MSQRFEPLAGVSLLRFAELSETVDAGRLMEKPCDEEYDNRSYFEIHPPTGHLLSPSDLQPSYSAQTTTKITLTKPQKLGQKIINPKPHTMTVTVCKPSPAQPKTPVKKEERIIPEQLF